MTSVMGTSLLAAFALFVVFFGGLAIAPKDRVGRTVGALIAAVLAGLSWAGVVVLARQRGWVQTEEAQFHHVYVLGAVGLPLAGLIILIASFLRPANDRRARTLGRGIALAFMAPAAVGLYATNIEPSWLRVDTVQLAVSSGNEPSSSDTSSDTTVRIGVVADIQTDTFGDHERAAMDAVTSERPDLILLAGDLTQVAPSAYPALVSPAVETLERLEADHGVFMISGNTDPSVDSVVDLAESARIDALADEVVELEIRGTRLRILGLSWPNNRRAAVTEAIRDFEATATEDAIDIVLAHSPDVVFNVAEPESIDLVITGHTHGGQIQVPLYGPLWNVTELSRDVAGGGLHDVAGVPVYVSTGVGVQRGESPKVRFGVRPSVGVIEIS